MGNHKNNGDMRKTGDDFRLCAGPVDTFARAQRAPFDLPEIIGLSAPVGPPVLFAIARDPRSIFTYWSVDWPSVFEFAKPADRKAHLRVYRAGAEESSAVVEPMSGNHYLTVAQPGDVYRVEIGYFQPGEKWCPVAMSEEITMPVEGPANSLDVDLATLPFHLSFQRLINLFRANNGDALVEIISRLQRRAVSAEERELLRPEDWEILRAMDLSVDEFGPARQAFLDSPSNQKLVRRAEAVLGFGATSPSHPFGGSSWS